MKGCSSPRCHSLIGVVLNGSDEIGGCRASVQPMQGQSRGRHFQAPRWQQRHGALMFPRQPAQKDGWGGFASACARDTTRLTVSSLHWLRSGKKWISKRRLWSVCKWRSQLSDLLHVRGRGGSDEYLWSSHGLIKKQPLPCHSPLASRLSPPFNLAARWGRKCANYH